MLLYHELDGELAVTGATSVPKFTNIKEQNEWYLNRAKTDIQKCKPNLGQGQAG